MHTHTCIQVPTEARREYQTPWGWMTGSVNHLMWVLATVLSSPRERLMLLTAERQSPFPTETLQMSFVHPAPDMMLPGLSGPTRVRVVRHGLDRAVTPANDPRNTTEGSQRLAPCSWELQNQVQLPRPFALTPPRKINAEVGQGLKRGPGPRTRSTECECLRRDQRVSTKEEPGAKALPSPAQY